MKKETDSSGGITRAFTIKGETTTYRERLTWHSNSARSFSYTHVEGIAGVASYHARLEVSSVNKTCCTLTMSAILSASEPRATEITEGTRAIFDDAINTIGSVIKDSQDSPAISSTHSCNTETFNVPATTLSVKGTPTLTASIIESDNTDIDTLCLFLHGIGGNRHNWQQQLPAVAPYCRAASLDLRGYGDSNLADTQSTIEDYCADIIRVCESLNVKKIILCGLSYGAWIATSFAMRYPERLVGLILSGGCTGMSEASVAEQTAFRQSREVPLNKGLTPADFASEVVSVIAGPEISDPVKMALLDSMRSISTDTYKDAIRCFTTPSEKFDFSRIKVPVLLMTGEFDRLAPPDEILAVAERIHDASPQPDVRFECLTNAGHVCNLESPLAYNQSIAEFVQRVVS